MNEDKAGKIIDRIVGEHIVPVPRWRVGLRFGLRWAMFVIVAALSATALSVAALFVFDADLDLLGFGGKPMFRELVHPVIIAWAVLCAGFLILAFSGLRRTRKGYRLSTALLIGIPILLVASLAAAFSLGRVGERIDQGIGKRFESYESHERFREKRWSDPARGRIGGTLGTVVDDTVTVNGFDGERWMIRVDDDTSIRPSVTMREGEKVRVVVEPIPGDGFKAEDIRPWERQPEPVHEPRHTGESEHPGRETGESGKSENSR